MVAVDASGADPPLASILESPGPSWQLVRARTSTYSIEGGPEATDPGFERARAEAIERKAQKLRPLIVQVFSIGFAFNSFNFPLLPLLILQGQINWPL